MANFCCSIELEPRTLKQGQLNHARILLSVREKDYSNIKRIAHHFSDEMAADAAQKMEQREFSIFIRGLSEIEQIKENEIQLQDDSPQIDQSKKKDQITENPCQCSCSVVNNECPDNGMDFKEPVTAPF
ncbi:hypothetical protein SLEP1_g36368 [Rubroshorea leprosula]|uniref:Uncharacterized protein n=1 Tax=Rubroshorea leprosula TaxID=152421 RepID=A0AAV5KR93_9ROSI|nr:hypothetical protein SLEP1_g36368 [Rubroshorea leprosula]